MKFIGSIAFKKLCELLSVKKVSKFNVGNKDRLFVTLHTEASTIDLYLSLKSCQIIEQDGLDEKVLDDANVIQYDDAGNEFRISISGCSAYPTNKEISDIIGMDFQTGKFSVMLFRKGLKKNI